MLSAEMSTDTSFRLEKQQRFRTPQHGLAHNNTCVIFLSGETFGGLWWSAMERCWWALLVGGGELETLSAKPVMLATAAGSLP